MKEVKIRCRAPPGEQRWHADLRKHQGHSMQRARPGWSSGQNGFRMGDPVAAIEGQELGQSATLERVPETRLVAHLGERARRILKNVAGKTLSRR